MRERNAPRRSPRALLADASGGVVYYDHNGGEAPVVLGTTVDDLG